MSSRLLFSADDEVPDIENPPHRPRMISRTKHFLPFSLPRVPLSTLTMQMQMHCYVFFFFFLLCLLACCLIYSLHKILGLLHLTVVAILFLFLAYFLFKTVSRTDLQSFFTNNRPIFFYRDEPLAARVSRINVLGVELLLDESIYAGEFREGIRNGRGVMKMPGIMCSYGGDWVEGAYDGYGVEDMAGISGHVYQGQFLEGKRSGYGLMKYCNGDQYKGQWLGDETHGRGKHTYADGYSYEGQFKTGMRHGFGVCHHSNGDIYRGEYYNDTCLGLGTCAFSNGDTCEGSRHQNQMHGYGVLYTGNQMRNM
ncbi:junctophilin-3-like protein [Carex littledalei]|uniref:Junctophilin-3-like protein n=1 Tax=Carex littledalei TaxID=544730 RepID=A0A833R5D5_9POAL|nr:junctophilin-3-like protein [Carex littledalei]